MYIKNINGKFISTYMTLVYHYFGLAPFPFISYSLARLDSYTVSVFISPCIIFKTIQQASTVLLQYLFNYLYFILHLQIQNMNDLN